jgi:hypothetical protein
MTREKPDKAVHPEGPLKILILIEKTFGKLLSFQRVLFAK